MGKLKSEQPPPRIPVTEGWESGRIRQFGILVYSQGTASSNLAPSATYACARWGASGPLRSSTRSCGAERCSEGVGGRVRPRESGDEGRALCGACQ